MQWWEWSVWAFIGNAAQVVSLVAIVFAISELLARRRRMLSTAFLVDSYGRNYDNVGEGWVELFEISVSGVDDVAIQFVGFVGATYEPTDELRISWRANSGALNRIAVRSDDITQAWIVLAWVPLEDRRFLWVRWYPLGGLSTLNDELKRQTLAHPLPHGWQRLWRRQFIAPVGPGPGNTWVRKVRTGRRSKGDGSEILPTLLNVEARGGNLEVPGRVRARAKDIQEPTRDGTA